MNGLIPRGLKLPPPLPLTLSPRDEFVYQRHWPIIQGCLRLPPGMRVTMSRGTEGTHIIYALLDTLDSYHPENASTIQTAEIVYGPGVPVEYVVEKVRRAVRKLWDHELEEWCKLGNEFLFGDPHA